MNFQDARSCLQCGYVAVYNLNSFESFREICERMEDRDQRGKRRG